MKLNITRIKIIMAEQGLTQKAAAARCGITAQKFGLILMRGTCEPRTAGKLARGLDIPVEDIIMEEV